MRNVCKSKKEKLVAYVEAELSKEEKDALETHLRNCETCRSEVEQLKILQSEISKSGLQDDAVPPVELKERFNQFLWSEMHQASDAPRRNDQRNWMSVIFQSATLSGLAVFVFAAIGLFATGVFIGSRIHSTDEVGVPEQMHQEVQVLNEQVEQLKLFYLANAFDSNKPSERLHALQTSVVQEPEDLAASKTTLKWLLRYLYEDSNTNVRSMALSLLEPYRKDPTVSAGLLNALKTESEPIIQLQLIQLLSVEQGSQLAPILKSLLLKPSTHDLVKGAALEVLQLMENGQNQTLITTNNNII